MSGRRFVRPVWVSRRGNSAGRANASSCGVRANREEEFVDVRRACDAWLEVREEKTGRKDFFYGSQSNQMKGRTA
jgi:hypothetical protein